MTAHPTSRCSKQPELLSLWALGASFGHESVLESLGGHQADRVFSQQKSAVAPKQQHVVESSSGLRECEAAGRLPASHGPRQT